jgi:hypothetical protein
MNTEDEIPDFTRASADFFCPICGKRFGEHPYDMEHLAYGGEPFLRILCDGSRVKL